MLIIVNFLTLALTVAKCNLHAYTGTQLKVREEIMVNVKYNEQECTLPMMVVKADTHTPLLFGRSWLQAIQLDWQTIFSQGQYTVQADIVDDLKTKYADIFRQELGTAKGIKATLHIKENIKPVFCKARQVPFALRPAVEKELARMQSEGIVVPADFNEWVTPLVCVPKPDGTVCLCGDYRTTVNKSINTDQFLIPTAEEIRSKLAGGERFQKSILSMHTSRCCLMRNPIRDCLGIPDYLLVYPQAQQFGSNLWSKYLVEWRVFV